jgi:hypothetical protein
MLYTVPPFILTMSRTIIWAPPFRQNIMATDIARSANAIVQWLQQPGAHARSGREKERNQHELYRDPHRAAGLAHRRHPHPDHAAPAEYIIALYLIIIGLVGLFGTRI